MIGCHLSHRHCWERTLERDEPYALVLEDDVVLGPQIALLPGLFEELEKVDPDWDLVYLGRISQRDSFAAMDLMHVSHFFQERGKKRHDRRLGQYIVDAATRFRSRKMDVWSQHFDRSNVRSIPHFAKRFVRAP